MFLKDDTDIVVTMGDKGNSTIIIFREEYERKMQEILNNQEEFTETKKIQHTRYRPRPTITSMG